MRRYTRVYLILLLVFGSTNNFAADAMAANGVELRGTPEQGGLVYGHVAADARVRLDGVAVRTTPNGDFVIGFGRDAKPKAQLAIEHNGHSETRVLAVVQRQYAIQSVTGVPQRTVEPPADEMKRILAEQKKIVAARAINSDRLDFLGPFQWPLQGRISGVYGSQRVYNGEPGRPHFGVDIAAPKGTPAHAPAAGTVTLAESDLFFSGGTLIIDHGYGISSTFIHLSRLLVKVGDKVQAGQVVAEVGATGRATGPHLDWRINWFQVRLDPQLVAPPMPVQATSN